MKSCRSSRIVLFKKWVLCLSLFSGVHQTAAAVHDDQLIISLESYQLTLLSLPQEILLDHNFKKEIDVVMYLATQQLGHERIATVIQILSTDYGSPIDNLTTFIQAALKKFTLIPTERNQLLFALLFMTSLLKQHAHVPLTRNLSVIEFHHEFHAAATTVQQAFQTTAEQLKQFLPPPPRKSWLKKALTCSIIGAAACAVWWLLTRSSREKPVIHRKRDGTPLKVPALVDVPALVADIGDRLKDVEGDLSEQLTADLARLTEAETAVRTAAIESLRRELATERGAREGAIAAENRERISAIATITTAIARNYTSQAEERGRVDTELQALGRIIHTTKDIIADCTRELANIRHQLALAEGRIDFHKQIISEHDRTFADLRRELAAERHTREIREDSLVPLVSPREPVLPYLVRPIRPPQPHVPPSAAAALAALVA